MTSRPRVPKSPESFPNARLAAMDFDNTVAQTFEKSPAGIDVQAAYAYAIDDVFDPDELSTYRASGGLQNRAPLEVVTSLMPGASPEELKAKEQEMNRAKLSILLGEIGTRFNDGQVWPRPLPGYMDFRMSLEDARNDGIRIEDAIISSGHEEFIKKTFSAWSVNHPTHIVAVETMDRVGYGHEVKPSPILMDIVRNFWREGYGLNFWRDASDDELRRIVFAGDDIIKDGQLAANSGVDFVHVPDIHTSRCAFIDIAHRLGIGKTAIGGHAVNG
jgi:hypothetical protein